jgi:hypothetical protein
MTQETRPDTVLGDFDRVRLGDKPAYLLTHTPQGYFVDIVAADGGTARHAIPTVTGSHHMQIYWYESGEDRRVTDPAARKPVAQLIPGLVSEQERARFAPFLSARDDHPMQLLE